MVANKILVIGAEGQLGREFQAGLEKRSIDVVAPKEKDCSITDVEAVGRILRESKANVVINCAAYNAVDQAEEDQDLADLINHRSVAGLAQLCNENDCRLVHYSTDYVFDGNKQDLYLESDATNPINVYGRSKLDGEQAALEANSDNLVFRLSWVIGKGESNFLFKFSNWVKGKQSIEVSEDEISIPTFTRDIVPLTFEALNKGLSGLYQMTSSGYASRYELARYYAECKGLDISIMPVPMSKFKTKAKRPGFSAMANDRLALDLKTEIPEWRDSLLMYVNETQ